MALMLASGCNVRGRGPRDASARHPGDRCCSRRHPLTALDRCIQRHLARSPLSCSNLNCGSSGAAVVASARSADAIRRLPFVTGVSADTVKQLDSVRTSGAPRMAAPAAALPGTPYWLDLIDAEKNTSYDGSGVWVAVLDSGFYPNWRDYFDPAKILTDKARAFVAAN